VRIAVSGPDNRPHSTISDSVNTVALVQDSTSLPIMLFSLVSGTLADSFDRRQIMLIASALLTVCAWFGLITPWLLPFFTFLIGCDAALNNPSWQRPPSANGAARGAAGGGAEQHGHQHHPPGRSGDRRRDRRCGRCAAAFAANTLSA